MRADYVDVMKRGFLFGLGFCLLIVAVGSLDTFVVGSGPIGLLLGLGCIALSIAVIRAAISAPSRQSRLHALAGWCVGFFIIDASIFAVIAAGMLLFALLK
jgi:hypothetical protein